MSLRSGTQKYGDLALEKRFERQEEENRLLDTPFITCLLYTSPSPRD